MKTHKTYFTQQDYERAFGSGSFRNAKLFTSTFEGIFSVHPPENLIHMSTTQLERLIIRLARSKKVKELQTATAEDIKEAEDSLQHLITITLGQLQKVGILPADKEKIYGHDKPYQEVWAYCGTNLSDRRERLIFEPPMPIAKGLFASSIPLENIIFTPENTFYSDLSRLFRDDKLSCEHGSADVRLRRTGEVYVYRDKQRDEQLQDRVIKTIQNTADNFYKYGGIKSSERRYATAEQDIFDELYKMFNTLKTEGRINYKKAYKVFEWILRENFDTDQLIKEPELRNALRQEIEGNITLPYAVIRKRVKDPFSEFLKVLTALYNITRGDEKKDIKKYQDKRGLRVIVKDTNHVFALQKSLHNIVGLEVIEEADYITVPKPNGYQSYHMVIEWGGTRYDLQIRTHKMDRDQEKDPNQSHDAKLMEKLEALKVVPDPVKLVVATVYGVFNHRLQ